MHFFVWQGHLVSFAKNVLYVFIAGVFFAWYALVWPQCHVARATIQRKVTQPLFAWRLNKNMTQCQLCKRQKGPIIPLSWTGLACKWVSPMDVITRGHLRIIFLSSRPFSAKEQTTSWSTTLLLTSEKAVFCNNWKVEIGLLRFPLNPFGQDCWTMNMLASFTLQCPSYTIMILKLDYFRLEFYCTIWCLYRIQLSAADDMWGKSYRRHRNPHWTLFHYDQPQLLLN